MFKELPDIHTEIAEAMTKIRHIVEQGHERDFLPSGQDQKIMELTNMWLEFQKEEAIATLY